jgi:hypothetical protein
VRLRRRIARWIGCLALATALAGCESFEPISIPLVYESEPGPDLADRTFPILLSGWTEKPQEDETRGYFLWPFVHYVREGRETSFGILGVDIYQQRVDHRGFIDTDCILGPVLYGHSADEGSYLTILPFGGTLKGKLGKSYALLILPPFFFYGEDNRGVGPEGDVAKTTWVLFPFVNWVKGGGRSGFKVFPFYAHYEKTDADGRDSYARTWVLWPFWTYQRNQLNCGKGEQRMFFLFPFYGRSDGPNTSQCAVLWPFFRWYENRGTSAGGPFWEFKFWPFFAVHHGRYRDRLDFWPFWGHKERTVPIVTGKGGYERYERTFVLWPFFRWERQDSDLLETRRFFFAPFLWSFATEGKDGKGRSREFKIWPLFRYKEWPDGRLTVNLFSPLWFQDPEGGFERIYNPLFRIYEHGRTEEGGERTLFLWGLVQSRENEKRASFTVHPFLYWNERAKNDTSREENFLFGLFQYRRQGKERGLRFFWLPWFPTWEADE